MEYPVGYLITFTTYGTWLHGDKKGSVDREHNRYAGAFVAPNPNLQNKQRHALKNPPVMLDKTQQKAALEVILRVCDFRGWLAHAVHVRSNHIHVVVSGAEKPEKMMRNFKAYATRAIKSCTDVEPIIKKYWTRHGSTRYLWTKDNLASAINYVKDGQGDMMTFGMSEPRM